MGSEGFHGYGLTFADLYMDLPLQTGVLFAG